MGSTARLALPYPDTSSSVDVPRDVKALAEKIDLSTGLAFAGYASLMFVPGNGTISASAHVTFPAGRFTQGPSIVVTPYYYSYFSTGLVDASVGGVTVALYNSVGQVLTVGVNFPVFIHAIQPKPTGMDSMMRNLPETRTGSPAIPRVATCRTADCDNLDIPIDITTPEADTPVVCGVCLTLIADVVPAP